MQASLTRVAIAIQGGAGNTAFAAGALRTLFEEGVHERFRIVSLSGSSGGAITAALAWSALLLGDTDPWRRVDAFWRDRMAVTPDERAWNAQLLETLEDSDAVRLPAVQVDGRSPLVAAMYGLSLRGLRPDFTDLRRLLLRHLDFPALAPMATDPRAPALVVGAVDVLSGRLAKFSSHVQSLQVEHLLASCAQPNLNPAVEIDGHSYWDGLYSDNPPISELVQFAYVGEHNQPDEIWVVKVNPTRAAGVPGDVDAVSDRRAEILGNLSMFQQLDALRLLNELFLLGGMDAEFARRREIRGPIRIPPPDDDAAPRPYHVPFIEPSPELVQGAGYATKIDRSRERIEALIADGRRQASAFLQLREEQIED
jgi:NTE family protein